MQGSTSTEAVVEAIKELGYTVPEAEKTGQTRKNLLMAGSSNPRDSAHVVFAAKEIILATSGDPKQVISTVSQVSASARV